VINGDLIKCLAENIAVGPLCERLEAEPDLWRENTWRQDYVVQLERPISPQQDTEAVMFRWAPENTIESVRDSLNVQNHKNIFNIKEVKPLLFECLKAARAIKLGRAFIAKLKPEGVVIPHRDYGMYADHFERFHLVLTSDEGNEFFVQDSNGKAEAAYMKPGEFFWFNHKQVHWAINKSKTPRMHLIIDAVSPTYRRERAPLSA
jgi:hypothetical protein